MFGTFRYNKTHKEAEYVELFRESGVDARGYTLIVSLQSPHYGWSALLTAITGMRTMSCPQGKFRRPRWFQDCLGRTIKAHFKTQLKCSGERGGCSRCLASSAECVYGPEGDGYENGRRTGRSKGVTRRRRRQTVPPKSSATDNDRPPTTAPNSRTTTALDDPPRRTWDAENGDTRWADMDESSAAPPDWTKDAAAHGHHSDAPPITDWSSELFGSNDFTGINEESTSFGLNSTDSPAFGTLSDFGLSATPGHAPSLFQPQPPGKSTNVPSTSSAALSIPEDTVPLTSQESEICFPRLGTTRPGGGCQCLTTLAGILERLGRYRLGDKPKSDKILDCLLFSLGTGVDACKKVLSCKDCNACQEHSILLATIAERLPHICNDLCGCLLVHQHQLRAAIGTGALSESPASSSFSGDRSGGNPHREKEGQLTLVDGENSSSFGRYKAQAAQIRLRLIKNLMALYMTDFFAVLEQMFQRIGQVDGTVGMLDQSREMATTAQWMLQQLRSGS